MIRIRKSYQQWFWFFVWILDPESGLNICMVPMVYGGRRRKNGTGSWILDSYSMFVGFEYVLGISYCKFGTGCGLGRRNVLKWFRFVYARFLSGIGMIVSGSSEDWQCRTVSLHTNLNGSGSGCRYGLRNVCSRMRLTPDPEFLSGIKDKFKVFIPLSYGPGSDMWRIGNVNCYYLCCLWLGWKRMLGRLATPICRGLVGCYPRAWTV
jgi:hypothetical protein